MRFLFVCFGNTDRSPIAECVMRHLLAGYGAAHTAASAGVLAQEGLPPSYGAVSILMSHGLYPRGKRSRRFTRDDYTTFDRILAVDRFVYNRVLTICGSDPDSKIGMLRTYDIEDPIDNDGFRRVYDQIEAGCRELLKEIE